MTLQSINLDASPPTGFQYGLTNIPNASAVQSNARLGYHISGDARFTFVPLLNSGTASVFIPSDASFDSFGLSVTGLETRRGRWKSGWTTFPPTRSRVRPTAACS